MPQPQDDALLMAHKRMLPLEDYLARYYYDIQIMLEQDIDLLLRGPNNLTVEKIRVGNSNIRNPILASYVAKGLLPYHGLGSGINRALAKWPDIDFVDDREGCLFTVTIRRKAFIGEPESGSSPKSSPISSSLMEDKIIELIRQESSITTTQLEAALGISKRAALKQIDKLKKHNRLRHNLGTGRFFGTKKGC